MRNSGLSSAFPTSRRAARRADGDYGLTADPDWRDVVWRDHVHAAEVAGRTVSYVDMGSPDEGTVVLVHGLSGCWQNWLETIPRLAQTRRVIALDLPGFGRSELPADGVSISGYGRCVDELCEQLGTGPVAVIGNSMGGFIGAEVAIQFPARVERLVLVSAAGISAAYLRREPVLAGGRIVAAMATRGAAQNERVLRRPAWTHAAFAYVFRHPTRMARDLLWEQMQGAGKPGFLPALEAIVTYDFRDRLPEIACPTLVVWGRHDCLIPVRDADKFEQLIPDARKVVLEDTGHVAMLERPRTFNRLICGFLAEEGSAERSAGEAPAAA